VPADDLNAPLGQKKKAKRLQLPVKIPTAVAGVLGLVLAVFAGWALVASDPMGGEPSAVIALAPPSEGKPPASDTVAKIEAPVQAEAPAQGTVTIIDGTTGKRQEVQIAGAGAGSQTAGPAGGDVRLLESTRHGMIPKVGTDGRRPADVYARVQPSMAKSDVPRIAIVVSGLGVGAKLTADAIAKLPAPVTLAFTPYGPETANYVSKARESNHEILLQVAMEPFDYPDNDPGPQTLLTSLAFEQNVDRLYWMMSRFQGYVGISNYMGARFTSNEASFLPILKEVAKRGLIYFDDGASSRSLAAQISGATRLTFSKSDVAVDAVPTPTEIGKALSRLENVARSNGIAVGTLSALPISIDRVAQWAKTVESRGFILVPISVAAARSKSS